MISLRQQEQDSPTAEQSAFPRVDSENDFSENGAVSSVWTYGGMTKREYFIGCALSGAMSSGAVLTIANRGEGAEVRGVSSTNDRVVRAAIAIADKTCEYLDEEKRMAKDGQ